MRREITKRYNYLSSEINSLYHQAAKKMGISDSVQNILYVLCDQGNQALQSEICSISGISRQTINSALSKLEQQGLVRVEPDKGRNTMVFLTEEGQKFAAEKIVAHAQYSSKIRTADHARPLGRGNRVESALTGTPLPHHYAHSVLSVRTCRSASGGF